MKTLVDTSVWLEYFRKGFTPLEDLLSERKAVIHPVVIGELSCGNFKHREKTLGDLKLLPRVPEASFNEVLELVESRRLYGKGLGFGDVQLLASALISGLSLLTLDKAAHRAAKELGVEY